MPERYFGKEIKVISAEGVKAPRSFTLEGQEYPVKEVLEFWPDSGYGSAETGKNWRTKHHRSYYRVKTEDGSVFEMYFDHSTNLKHPEFRKWYLTQRLEP
jgi:hypothetical protein